MTSNRTATGELISFEHVSYLYIYIYTYRPGIPATLFLPVQQESTEKMIQTSNIIAINDDQRTSTSIGHLGIVIPIGWIDKHGDGIQCFHWRYQ